MKSTSWLWRGLSSVTMICLLVLLTGFAWALKDHWIPSAGLAVPKASKPPAAAAGSLASKPSIKIAAIGDSLTVGTGDATGQGYVRRTADLLGEATGKPVRIVNNLAVGGMRADLLLGFLDDKGYVNAIVQSDLILLTIGGNDLFQIASNGGAAGEGGDLSPEQLESRLPETEKRLRDVLDKLRTINPAARIVYVGLYNPFYDLDKMRPASGHVQAWNAFAHGWAAADGNATVVPTYDLFESDIGKYLSSDHFHPNEAGYERMADRIVQAIQ